MRSACVAVILAFAMIGCAGRRAESWHAEGVELSKAGKYREAIDAYGRAITTDPKLAKAHYNMGLNYLRMRQPDQAAACFRRVLEINPADVDASRHLTIAQVAIQSRSAAYE